MVDELKEDNLACAGELRKSQMKGPERNSRSGKHIGLWPKFVEREH
jgi:hypothetical protein